MFFRIRHKEMYSRGELLLRTFLGIFYIVIPHIFILLFLSLWNAILNFINFWIILFTGKYHESFFEFQVKLLRWSTRLSATMYNLVDGYPAFGLDSSHPDIYLDIPYPTQLSRGKLLLKTFFAFFYVLIPHIFILYFRLIWTAILSFISFWVVLFTGNFPKNWHAFIVGTMRWSTRLSIFMNNMNQEYPAFTGRELPSEKLPFENDSNYDDWH